MHTQAFFEDIQSEIVKVLYKAYKFIYVAVAWFTDNELYDILCPKAGERFVVSAMLLNNEIDTDTLSLKIVANAW